MVPCRRLFFLTSFAVLIGFAKGQDMVWKTAFSLSNEHELARDSLLTTLPNLTKEWRVSLEVNPTDYTSGGYGSVLHMTIGGKGLGNKAKVGDRTPAIWIHKKGRVMISSAVNGEVDYRKIFRILPPAGEWTSIEVSQSLAESKHMYRISIANTTLFEIENTMPVELSNVKVYAGSPWNDARKGFIRNLEIDIKVPCIVAGETLF